MGRASALALAQEGFDVAVLARRKPELETLAEEVRAAGRRPHVEPVDLTDAADARRSVAAVVDHCGRIDVLVYAAGWNIPKRRLEELSADDWETMQRVNLWGLYDVAQEALPALRTSGGRLVIISSASVMMPDVSGVAYQAAKHGEAGIALGLMHEEAANGVRATVIYPGLTDTQLLKQRPTPTPPETVAQALQPADVAQAVVFVSTLPDRAYVPELTLLPAAIQQR
jgi:NADP-dependent 3-hydroxy acid dehydrogenase YdfG